MATSTLISYEPVESFRDRAGYWKEYMDFYELYWGGPTSPFGVWFGNEYEVFRRSMAAHLDMDEEEIEDCFFMKDGSGRYYLAPIRSGANLLFSENLIPFYWFLLFADTERELLITRWGFSAIHYDTRISLSLERIKKARGMIENHLALHEKQSRKDHAHIYREILKGLDVVGQWLSGFDDTGCLVLNYGEICSLIQPSTIHNERSVREIWEILGLLESENYEKASTGMNILIHKWREISDKASGKTDSSQLQ